PARAQSAQARLASVVGGELLGEEGERPQQEQAHDDQREVFVHGFTRTIAREKEPRWPAARARGDAREGARPPEASACGRLACLCVSRSSALPARRRCTARRESYRFEL